MLNFSKLQIFLAAIISSIVLIVSAFYYYKLETASIQKEKFEYLSAIANLKIDQISKWKNERLSEAKFFPTVGKLIRSTVLLKQDLQNTEAREYLTETLLPIKDRHRYKNLLSADLNGRVLFSLDSSLTSLDSVTTFNSKKAVDEDSIFFSDFYYCPFHSEIHLDIYSPIKDNEKRIIAVFILRIDPKEYLFPMIQKWPTPSRSAETLIYRKEENAVRPLTGGKSLKNDSLNIVIPFEKSDYVSVKGIFNHGEVIEGVDYKNSEVLAAISPIEGTNWYLISKVDKDEIYEDLFFKGWAIIALLFVSLLLIFVTVMYLFRLRQSEIYKNLFYKERELFETQERYKTTLYSIGDAVITTDAGGNIKNMNSVAEQLTGWKESESSGKKLKEVFKVVNEDTNLEVEDPVSRVLQSKTVVGLANHTMLIKKDGSTIPISDSGSPIKDDKGNIIGVVLVFRDQTEERIKEKILFESNEKYAKILNSSTDSISLTELRTGKLLEINDGFEKMFGFSRDEALGSTSLELGLWRIPAEREKMISLLKVSGKVRNLEATGKRKNGELFTGLLSGEVVSINDETLIILFVRDITERKKLELILKTEKDRISAILNLVGDPIFVKDDQHRFILGNKAFFEMVGLVEGDVIGKTLAENIPEDEMEHFLKVDRLVLETGVPDTREEELTINNQTRTIVTSKTRFIDDSGNRLLIGSIHDITELINADKEKAHLNELMKFVISNTKSSVSVFDTDMNYIYVSDRYFEDFHLVDRNIIGRNHYDVFPDLPQFLRDIHKRALNGETISGEDDRLLHPDGSMDWANWTCMPWYNTDRAIGGIIVYLEVITERKKAEKEFKEAEERFRKAFITSPDSININRLSDGKYVSINAGFTRMTGYEEHEVIGKTSAEIQIWANIKYRNELVALLSKTSLVSNFEAKFRMKDGSIKDGLMSAAVIELKGEPHIISITRDISDRKKAEEEILRTKTHYQKLIENAPDGIVQISSEGVFKYVSPSAKRMFGHPLDQRIEELPENLTHPDDVGFVQSAIAELIQKPDETKTIEYRFRHTNGNYLWIESTFTNLLNDPAVNAIVINFRDITDRKKLITQLTESKTKAEEMVKLKSYFFANMSHELRTPFVGILGFAEILKDTLQNSNEREYAEQILKSSKRLTETLNKILNVTRLEFDKVDIKLKEFDIVKMLKNVEALYSSSAKINKTIISTITEEQSIIIKSDAKLLEDILNNLVNNAVKFTHNGSIKLSAHKIISDKKPSLEITVEDSGIGIPAEKQKLVWQEFRQASEGLNRSFEGTGLGLTISKKYAELLGGSISLKSEERKGSVFTVLLPLDNETANTFTDITIPKTEHKILTKKQTSGKPKILYVEDDIVALQYINIVLKSGYEVDTAFSAKEALERVAIKNYDTLMLDINLGSGMDGLELMQKIRENNYYKTVPVVAVTAYAADSDKAEFLMKGFNYYISKPFTQKELHKLLNDIFTSK